MFTLSLASVGFDVAFVCCKWKYFVYDCRLCFDYGFRWCTVKT